MKYRFLMIATMLLPAVAAHANGSRLTVLNEVIEPVCGVESTFGLYLSRLGTYYAELYLEPGESVAAARQSPLDIALTISFVHREKPVVTRDLELRFAPGENVATLFFLDSPFDLPQRKNLEIVVKFHVVDPRLREYYDAVRLQLTRKIHIVPFTL